MNNGLTIRDIETISEIFRKYPAVKKVNIFGSRAKKTFKEGSDIDLAIMNEGVNDSIIRNLKEDFEESSLPYFVDLINYPSLNHSDLKEHIDRVGIEIYRY